MPAGHVPEGSPSSSNVQLAPCMPVSGNPDVVRAQDIYPLPSDKFLRFAKNTQAGVRVEAGILVYDWVSIGLAVRSGFPSKKS